MDGKGDAPRWPQEGYCTPEEYQKEHDRIFNRKEAKQTAEDIKEKLINAEDTTRQADENSKK